MTTIKRLFVAGAFWLAVKVLRISPAALIAAATSRPAPPEAHESDKDTNRYDIHNYIDGEHFTDDEIIVEGRLRGKHVGEFEGIKATGRNVELPFVAFYHFDKTDKLISERVVMNFGVLIASG